MPNSVITSTPVAAFQEDAIPLSGPDGDYDALLTLIGQARYVLLGEATHGTHEFYRARAEITKRLIRELGFTVIALEADWPDALQVNRFVRGGPPQNPLSALSGFERFPTWMWRNADILDFIGWLGSHNAQLPANAPKAGFYGLDLYSLHSSMTAVVSFLEKTDPAAAQTARQRYSCFEHFGGDPYVYGQIASQSGDSCEDAVIRQLLDLQQREADFLKTDGQPAADELFFAGQNARVAVKAEEYYRAMYRGRPNTWNLRDAHMVDTLANLTLHLTKNGHRPKVVVWAHNSHLGDARATEMRLRGEWNVGQLIRQQQGRNAVLVGFTTGTGTVTAATDWGGPTERKNVRPPLNGSYEQLFHDTGIPNFLLPLRDNQNLARQCERLFLERAIGVIYRPDAERWSHYFSADLAQQFDAVIHFDHTHAVEPLDRNAGWDAAELPETFPTGL